MGVTELGPVKWVPENLLPLSQPPLPRQPSWITVADCNQQNLEELLAYQEKESEACFVTGMYALLVAFYPQYSWPSPVDYRNLMRQNYPALKKGDKSLVDYAKIVDAISIFRDWGIELTMLTANIFIDGSLGKHIEGSSVPYRVIQTWEALSIDHLTPPYGTLLHESGDPQMHFFVVAGAQSTDMLKAYQANHKKVKAYLEFKPTGIFNFSIERGAGEWVQNRTPLN